MGVRVRVRQEVSVCRGGRVTALERSKSVLVPCRAVCALSIPKFPSRTVLRTWHSCEPGAVLGPLVDGGKPGRQSDWMILNPVERVGVPVACGLWDGWMPDGGTNSTGQERC